ncbi:hypothetical protein CRUP_036077 [Coryphaenoides rupestris]|nr:hypothetical protein CRUP_036077 [Coryphaenoides rupestris]
MAVVVLRLHLQVTLLVICALAFLVCVVFLVVYKVYQYEQPCPESFVYTQGRCMPAGMYGYYPPQGPGGRGRLFTIINHYNMAKQTITRSVSPWMTVMSEEKVTQQRRRPRRSWPEASLSPPPPPPPPPPLPPPPPPCSLRPSTPTSTEEAALTATHNVCVCAFQAKT